MNELLRRKAIVLWRWYAGVLLTIIAAMSSIGVKLLIQLNNKVEYSYKANVQQEMTNEHLNDKIETLNVMLKDVDTDQAVISERLYSIEAMVKYQRPQTFLNQN